MWKDLYTCANWGINPDQSDLCKYILQKYPVVHAWDDHDYGVNNGNGNYADKLLAHDMFARYFPSYALPPCTNGCAGIWQKFSYAYADFFILDSRSQRTPPCNPLDPLDPCTGDESMLKGFPVQGTQDQWTWLTQGLLDSTAIWKFIWSPVVFNRTMQKTDSWFGYPAERQALVNWINANNIKNVILLSGDLHAGAIDNGANADFPEMLTPAPNLTAISPKHCQSNGNRVRGAWSHGMYTTGAASTDPCNGYGVISVSPTAATLTIKDSNGNANDLVCNPQGTEPCVFPHEHISPLTVGAQ